MPHSISPALVKPAPMAKTAILPSSAMRSPRRTDSALSGLNWTQIPGAATQVVPASDGSIWALSTDPAGPDKYIWHYAGGTWTNVSGLASQIAVRPGPFPVLYAINSGGGTYAYQGNDSWTALGGGAANLTIASNGDVYVTSNQGGPDHAIWKNDGSTWTQVPGAGVYLAGGQAPSYYTLPGGHVSPGGLYVINSQGSIYYLNPDGTYVAFPGQASQIAPTFTGGAFVLGFPASSGAQPIYYYDLSDPNWTAQPGAASSLSASTTTLYVVGGGGGIYDTPISNGPALPPTQGQFGAWAPDDLANAFQYPVQAGFDGTGIGIAVIIDAMPLQSDLSTFMSQYGINRTGSITSVPVDGGGATVDNDGEATLDTETVSSMAPGANVMVYNIPDIGEGHMLDALNQVASDGKASVVSMSFGGCEFNTEDSIEGPVFSMLASKGIAVTISSGDWGNACPGPTGNAVVGASGPATNPNVIAVGGVETTENQVLTGNAVWNDCPASLSTPENCMGGGGVSGNGSSGFSGYPIPSYQQGLAGVSSTAKRNIPDISLPADLASLYQNGNWYVAGGTSWSAPLAAAMVAEIYQYCNTTSIANPVTLFYNAYNAAHYGDFIDVTAGNDQFMGLSPYYSAAAGYDDASGIGQPLGMAIARTECPNRRLGLARIASVSYQAAAPATARVLPRVPQTAGMTDMGVRDRQASTRVALVLRDSPSLASDEARVVSALQGAGFTIDRRFGDHLVVDVRGPASLVQSYFGTRLHDFAQRRYGRRYANTAPIVLPAAVAPYVSGVLADDLVLMTHSPVH